MVETLLQNSVPSGGGRLSRRHAEPHAAAARAHDVALASNRWHKWHAGFSHVHPIGSGRVTSRFFVDYYSERNITSNIMVRLGTGTTPVQATEASTHRLDLRAQWERRGRGGGTRFSVSVDITPKRIITRHFQRHGLSWLAITTGCGLLETPQIPRTSLQIPLRLTVSTGFGSCKLALRGTHSAHPDTGLVLTIGVAMTSRAGAWTTAIRRTRRCA